MKVKHYRRVNGDEWCFLFDGSKITITYPYGGAFRHSRFYEGFIKVPEVIENTPVTRLDDRVFASYKSLVGVSLPDSVSSWGDGAFYNSGLQSIRIGTGIKELPIMSLAETKIKKLDFGETRVRVIGESACAYNTKLEELALTGVKEIGRCAFIGCIRLKRIVIPSTVKRIGEYAFKDCVNLKEVVNLSELKLPKSAFINTKFEEGLREQVVVKS